MEENLNIIPKRRKNKFAVFLTVLATIATLFSSFIVFSSAFVIFCYLALFLIMLLTLFTVLVDDNFRALFNKGEGITVFIFSLYKYIPYLSGIAAALSLLSILIVSLSKKTTSKVPIIVFDCILVVINIVILVLSIIYKANAN